MPYHDATFRLLGDESSVSRRARAHLDEAEQRLGISLPASVRDWYQRESAGRILADHSNEDPPIEIGKFALTQWHDKILLPIRHENQGVCTWAVEIDGSDDPAVFVDVDTAGKHWNPLAGSFAGYVYSCVWDYQVVLNRPALVQAQNRGLSSAARRHLAEVLTAEVATYGWPGNTQYRFRHSRFGVLIWNGEGQADWFVGAPDRESLRLALETVGGIDSVGDSFYDRSEAGREVLTEMRTRSSR